VPFGDHTRTTHRALRSYAGSVIHNNHRHTTTRRGSGK
jgi:hypothetical protein